jgi:hypothetical protein
VRNTKVWLLYNLPVRCPGISGVISKVWLLYNLPVRCPGISGVISKVWLLYNLPVRCPGISGVISTFYVFHRFVWSEKYPEPVSKPTDQCYITARRSRDSGHQWRYRPCFHLGPRRNHHNISLFTHRSVCTKFSKGQSSVDIHDTYLPVKLSEVC